MPRPRKTSAEYFSHDKGARNNAKIKLLRKKFGSFRGYALWMFLLETLCGEDHLRLEISDDIQWEMTAADFDCEGDELREFLAYCDRLELVKIEPGIDQLPVTIRSPKLEERLAPLFEKREKAAARARKHHNRKKSTDSALEPPLSRVITPLESDETSENPDDHGVNGSNLAALNTQSAENAELSRVITPLSRERMQQSKVKESKGKKRESVSRDTRTQANVEGFEGEGEIKPSERREPQSGATTPEGVGSAHTGRENAPETAPDPSAIIAHKVCEVGDQEFDTWKLRYNCHLTRDNLRSSALEFADWYIGKHMSNMDDLTALSHARQTGGVVFRKRFATSWLRNDKKINGNGRSQNAKNGSEAARTGRTPGGIRETGRRKSEADF